ncbi:MAG: hypothetical protein QW795_08450 [Candidatus Bathyarchaeia archaeon]
MGFVESLLKGKEIDFSIPYGPKLWAALRKWPLEKWAQFNTLIRFASFACDDLTWWIYVETAMKPLGELVLALIDFDWDDILRGFLRPTGIRSRPGVLSELAESFLVKFEIPELGEVIGAHLPGARIVKRFTSHPATRALFKIDAMAQRALFYWMVLDVTTDFFYNWSLGLFRTRVCAASSVASSYIYCSSQTSRGAKNGEWGILNPVFIFCRRWHKGGGVADWTFFKWGHKYYDVYVVLMTMFRAGPFTDIYPVFWVGWDSDIGRLDEVGPIPEKTMVVTTAYIPRGVTAWPIFKYEGRYDVVHVLAQPLMIQGWCVGADAD